MTRLLTQCYDGLELSTVYVLRSHIIRVLGLGLLIQAWIWFFCPCASDPTNLNALDRCSDWSRKSMKPVFLLEPRAANAKRSTPS